MRAAPTAPIANPKGQVDPVTHTAETDTEEVSTRARVLDLIASDGPVTAAALAAELDLTAAAVRRHLSVLETEGRITVHVGVASGPARRGRPAKRYVVTADGQAVLSQEYSALASQALRFLAEIGGVDAVRSFAEKRVLDLEARHADAVAEAGVDIARRAEILAEELSDEGYAATARPVPGAMAIQLCQGHCPVQDVAAEFPELCEAEAHAFSRILGVHVQRLATLAHGGHVCTTSIPMIPIRPGNPGLDTPPVNRTEGRRA